MELVHPEHAFLQMGEATTKYWRNLRPLKDETLPIKVHIGAANLDADLKFYFREYPERSPSNNGDGAGVNGGGLQCWSLCVALTSCSKAIIQFRLDIDLVDQGRNGIPIRTQQVLTFQEGTQSQDPMLVVKKKFIRRPREAPTAVPAYHAQPLTADETMLKISVTPMFIMPEEVDVDDDEEESPIPVTITRARRNLYCDLKLETGDNKVIHCHKAILGARSKVLDAMILSVEGDFDATTGFTKLGVDVNAKPMSVILHWMYTGEEELHPEAGDCLKEVLDAAILFELTPFFKMLDRMLITICDRANMVQLFRIARTKKMYNARADISKFIREQLAGDANQ